MDDGQVDVTDVEIAQRPDPDAVELVVGPEIDGGRDAEFGETRAVVVVEAVRRVAPVHAAPLDAAPIARQISARSRKLTGPRSATRRDVTAPRPATLPGSRAPWSRPVLHEA